MYVTRLVLGDEKASWFHVDDGEQMFLIGWEVQTKSWVDLLETFCQG